MLLVCCVYATNTLLSNIPEGSVLVFFFFCNDLFENTLFVCCVYATNMLLQISLGKVVLVIIFFVCNIT